MKVDLADKISNKISESNGNHPQMEEITHCPECKSDHLVRDYQRGERVCEDCGLVVDDNFIDPGHEWRAYDAVETDKVIHTGDPTNYLFHDKGLSTTIGWKNVDASGRSLSHDERLRAYRLRKWQRRIRYHKSNERSLVVILEEFDKIINGKNVPKPVKDSAALVYRKAVDKSIVKGWKTENIVDAGIYIAFRRSSDKPRTLDEIAEFRIKKADRGFKYHRKEIGRAYRHLRDHLNIRLAPTEASQYLDRFCSKLYFRDHVRVVSTAGEILNAAREKDLLDGAPQGICAAAIWIASIKCKDWRAQEEIAKASDVTAVTLRNRYHRLVRALPEYTIK